MFYYCRQYCNSVRMTCSIKRLLILSYLRYDGYLWTTVKVVVRKKNKRCTFNGPRCRLQSARVDAVNRLNAVRLQPARASVLFSVRILNFVTQLLCSAISWLFFLRNLHRSTRTFFLPASGFVLVPDGCWHVRIIPAPARPVHCIAVALFINFTFNFALCLDSL